MRTISTVQLVLVLSAAYWAGVACFPSGAPGVACETLTPLITTHIDPPQTGPVPYQVNLSALDDGNVTVESNDSMQFRGVLLQGRVLADDTTPAGTFDTAPSSALLRPSDCSPNDISVTHMDNSDKDSVTATWTAPPAGTGTVRIAFTVVRVRTVYWADLRSDNIAEMSADTTTLAMDMDVVTDAIETTTMEVPETTMGMGGDPHFSIKLPSGKQLCYSVQGEQGFIFNLVSNRVLNMNALFVADSKREEVTWIGGLGMVIKNSQYKDSDLTTIRFDANKKQILIGGDVTLTAQNIEKLYFKGGKLTITEAKRGYNCSCFPVQIELPDVGLNFSIHFVKNNHIDMTWDNAEYLEDSHGIIGQFFRKGVDVDVARRLLFLPNMAPVPVMRKPIWHFMEREKKDEQQQLCWVAMNPGYQGKKLIQGHYLDYVVDDLLSTQLKREE